MIKSLEDFVREYTKIVNQGPIETHRAGDTGIGKTLEDLLGIAENNDQAPDFGDFELKAHRKNVNSMITLFTKSPVGKGTNAYILEKYGYYVGDKKKIHMSLQYGIYTPTKDLKHSLTVDVDKNNVYIIDENKNVVCMWDGETICNAIKKKYKTSQVVHALAYSEKICGVEYFSFMEAFLARGISGEKVIEAVKEGIVIIDLRIGTYTSGKPHDHGTGFRIKPKNQFDFYENLVDLVGSYVDEYNKRNS